MSRKTSIIEVSIDIRDLAALLDIFPNPSSRANLASLAVGTFIDLMIEMNKCTRPESSMQALHLLEKAGLTGLASRRKKIQTNLAKQIALELKPKEDEETFTPLEEEEDGEI